MIRGQFLESLVIGLALLVLLPGCSPCSPQEQPSDVISQSLKEDDWPVFKASCFIVQAPSDMEVYAVWPLHDIQGVEFRRSNTNEGKSTLLAIRAGNHFGTETGDEGYPLNIGGLDAIVVEEEVDRTYSGTVYLTTPLFFPQQIVGEYSDLSADERNVALQIMSTIRLNDKQEGTPDVLPVSEWEGVEPFQLAPSWNVTPSVPSDSARGQMCRLK